MFFEILDSLNKIEGLSKPVSPKHPKANELQEKRDKERKDNIAALLERVKDNPSAKKWVETLLQQFQMTPASDAPIHFPESLSKLMPYKEKGLLNEQLYREILPLVQLAYAYDKNGIPEEQAFKLATLFTSKRDMIQYLDRYKKSHLNQPTLHDACNIVLPPVTCSFKQWRKLANNNLTQEQFKRILPNAELIEKEIEKATLLKKKPDREQVRSIEATLSREIKRWKQLKKNHGELSDKEEEEYQKLAVSISENRVKLADAYDGTPLARANLNMLRAYYERIVLQQSKAYSCFLKHGLTPTDYHDKFLKLDRSKAGKLIPDITIDGAEIGFPGFYLKKVNVQDDFEAARAACIGKLTDCCQSLSGEAGEPCAIHGLTSERGGFYMLLRGDLNNPSEEDEVISASWAWLSKTDNLVFDSIEMHPRLRNPVVSEGVTGTQMAVSFFSFLGYQIVEKTPIKEIYCGQSSGISEYFGHKSHCGIQVFADYSGYYDACTQSIISRKKQPYLLIGKLHGKVLDASLRPLLSESILQFIREKDDDAIFGMAGYYLDNNLREYFSGLLEIIKSNGSKTSVKMVNSQITVLKLLDLLENTPPKDLESLHKDDESLLNKVQMMINEEPRLAVQRSSGRNAFIYILFNLLFKCEEVHKRKLFSMLSAQLAKMTPEQLVLHNALGESPLHRSLLMGNKEITLSLINKIKAEQLLSEDIYGQTALDLIVHTGNTEIAIALISKVTSEQLGLQDDQGKTALHYAILEGHTDIARALIAKMIPEDLGLQNLTMATPSALHLAIQKGNDSIAIALINKMSSEQLNTRDMEDNTAFKAALLAGKIEISKLLIKAMNSSQAENAYTDVLNILKKITRPEDAQSLLEITLILIEKESKLITLKSAEGKMLIYFLIKQFPWLHGMKPPEGKQYSELINMLIAKMPPDQLVEKNHFGQTALHEFISSDVFIIENSWLEQLLKQKPDLRIQNMLGHTVLHSLIFNHVSVTRAVPPFSLVDPGSLETFDVLPEMIKMLIDAGAPINAKDIQGRTVLHEAVERDDVGLVKLLLTYGADLDIKDESGETPRSLAMGDELQKLIQPLHYAAECGNLPLLTSLIEKGEKVNQVDTYGKTPLFCASTADVAKKLVEHKADVAFTDENGVTPLGFVSSAEVATVLLEAGSPVIASKSESTPLFVQCGSKNDEIILLLLEKGADASIKASGMNLLHRYLRFSMSSPGAKPTLNVVKVLVGSGIDVLEQAEHYGTVLDICKSDNISDDIVKYLEVEVAKKMAEKQTRKPALTISSIAGPSQEEATSTPSSQPQTLRKPTRKK